MALMWEAFSLAALLRIQIPRWKANGADALVRLKHRSEDMQLTVLDNAILTIWIRDLEYAK